MSRAGALSTKKGQPGAGGRCKRPPRLKGQGGEYERLLAKRFWGRQPTVLKAQAPAVHGPPRKRRLGWGHSDVSLCPRSSFRHLQQEANLFVRPSSPQAAPRSGYPLTPGACSMVLGGGRWSGQTMVPNLGGRLPGLWWSRSMACTPVGGACLSLVPNSESLCRHARGALNSHTFRCVPPLALKAASFL